MFLFTQVLGGFGIYLWPLPCLLLVEWVALNLPYFFLKKMHVFLKFLFCLGFYIIFVLCCKLLSVTFCKNDQLQMLIIIIIIV